MSVGENVDFATDCYTDVDSFEWDFSDGTAKLTGAQVSHSFSKTGSHKVKVKAKLKGGSDSSSEITITVS